MFIIHTQALYYHEINFKLFTKINAFLAGGGNNGDTGNSLKVTLFTTLLLTIVAAVASRQ